MAHDNKEVSPRSPELVKPPEAIGEHPFELRHEVKRLNERLDQIAESLDKAEIQDIIENYSSVKRRLVVNFVAGAARGLGLSLGTIVILAILGFILSQMVSLPLIGNYIAQILDYVKASQGR
ncbi:DUF5665 domain-containing protein [Paenibacillus sp. PK4536]|jgi:hypothetical protein|uniref:Uncharacterized protein n=1 Tax=Paenibacillus nuruki TaxID=1886670 RepID=A0A1E3L9E3_9BACL|nr:MULTISPECIES: DUF5665 domain-containing protein [Paenibacillus]ODP30388.1 hypothetical protein PTI45_00109 [Paenibacillus nuruki]TKJ83337.1 hypothetical protein PaeCFBP13512_22895 [Paenibacillus sp. CFBP13512]WIM39568.1 DUF5665 domain-containing protein [Paenibacillus sp. PK4536]